MAGQVRWHGCIHDGPYERVGKREPPIEEDVSRISNAGRSPSRGAGKKVVRPIVTSDGCGFGSVQKKWREKQEEAEYKGKPIPQPPPQVSLEYDSLLHIVKLLKGKHKAIKKYFNKKGVGEMLMIKDSQLMEKILLNLAKKGIPALPVHDELVVRLDNSTECWKVMKEEFKDMFGQSIEISGLFSEALDDAISRPRIKSRSPEMEKLEDMAIKDGPMIDEEEYQKLWRLFWVNT